MSRGPHNVRQADVTKAIKAAVKSGVKGWRIEIEPGKIVVRSGEERSGPTVESDRGEWD